VRCGAVRSRKEPDVDEMLRYLKALVVLQTETLRLVSDSEKPEVLLRRAGFRTKEIADMLGKRYMAVAKALSRAGGGSTADE